LKINGFPELVVEQFYVKFADVAASVSEISRGKTDRNTEKTVVKILPSDCSRRG